MMWLVWLHKRTLSLALAAWMISAATGSVAQQIPLSVPYSVEGVDYSESVPRPDEIIGHTIGTTHTRPHQIVDYFRAVASASDRVVFGEYGRTYENRPLVYAIVTSRRNHARLEALRTENLDLSDEPDDVSDEDLRGMPLIVNMHYSVHGNEASGSEAAILLLYHLAAGSGSRIDEILDSTIVVIDPSINPDGRDRFVDWVNGNRGAVATTDEADREHNEPWPGGRTNHYWFDLNRDWLPVRHPESEGRLDLFHAWRPQVLVDVHEMGGDQTFFFQPGVPSRGNPNTPQQTFDLTGELTRGSAQALDQIGSLYYSRETFDDFYYGKGSTFPDINGSIGILFEQGSSRGLLRPTDDGLLDYGYTVRNQLAASVGLLEKAAKMRVKLLANQRDFYAKALDDAEDAGFDGWLFGSELDPTRARVFAQLLRRHRIEIRPLKTDITVDAKTFEARNAFVIPVRQAQYRLLKASMERTTTFTDSVFYDVSTWTLPLAFGLQSAEYQGNINQISADPASIVEDLSGEVHNGPASYAYVMPWGRYYGARALHELLAADVPARVAIASFEAKSGDEMVYFDRGSIVIPLSRRDSHFDGEMDGDRSKAVADIHNLVRKLAARDQVEFFAVDGGLTETGIDLGSPRTIPLHERSIGIFSGRPFSGYRVGEVWHLFAEKMGIPISLLEFDRVSKIDLSAYDVLILADGDLKEDYTEASEILRPWIERGGRLIAMQRSAEWLAALGIGTAEFPREQTPDTVRWVRYGDKSAVKQSREISGAIFEADLDESHPISFGLGKRVALFKTRYSILKPPTEPGTVVAVYRPSPLLSGYAPTDRVAAISRTAAVTSQTLEKGRIVTIQDVPTFRAFWYGSDPILLNAAIFSEAF